MHRITSSYGVLTPQIQDLQLHKLLLYLNSHLLQLVDWRNGKPPAFSIYLGAQPSLIIRYAVIIVIVSNNQLPATDIQASVSLPITVKPLQSQ